VAEPAGVHRGGDDRLPVGVGTRSVVAGQQIAGPGQILDDLPVRPGGGRRGQRRIAAFGGGGHLLGGEPVRDVDHAAIGGIVRGQIVLGEYVEPGQQPPDHRGRVGGAEPSRRRGGVAVPVPGPDGSDGHHAAVIVKQVIEVVQDRCAAVGVRVVAQLTQPQHGPRRDPGLKPGRERGNGRRVLHHPVRKHVRDCLVDGPGGAGQRVAADHHQPAVLRRRVQDRTQPLVVRPAGIGR
jgi:hypothetical protein